MTAVEGEDRPRASEPWKDHFPSHLRPIHGQDLSVPNPFPSFHRPSGTVPSSCSGGSLGAEGASCPQKG